MDWDKLRIFHTVSEIKNFTHAGHALNLSQSAVSRQIGALEVSLGVSLFNRHARGLVLTEAGETLFTSTKKIFSEIHSTALQLSESQNSLKGTLRIAATVALGSVWLAPRLPKFFSAYPQFNIKLFLTDSDIDFSTREADISIRFGGDNNQDHTLTYDLLSKTYLKIYGSLSYFEENGLPCTIEDLSNHRLIVFGDYSSKPVEDVNWLLRLNMKAGETREPFLEINNAYGILQSVKNGLGVATLAEFIAKDHPDLIPILPNVECPQINIYMVYPKQFSELKRINIIKEFLKKELKS